MKVKHFIIFLIFISLVPASKAWDPLGLKGNIDDLKNAMNALADKLLAGADNLLAKARAAVKDTIDDLFDQKFVKMIAE